MEFFFWVWKIYHSILNRNNRNKIPVDGILKTWSLRSWEHWVYWLYPLKLGLAGSPVFCSAAAPAELVGFWVFSIWVLSIWVFDYWGLQQRSSSESDIQATEEWQKELACDKFIYKNKSDCVPWIWAEQQSRTVASEGEGLSWGQGTAPAPPMVWDPSCGPCSATDPTKSCLKGINIGVSLGQGIFTLQWMWQRAHGQQDMWLQGF